jgi:hypothetical protein
MEMRPSTWTFEKKIKNIVKCVNWNLKKWQNAVSIKKMKLDSNW